MQAAVQTGDSKESSGICFSREDKPDLHFAYGPEGNRLSKKAVYGNDSTVWTFYVRDAQGNTMATYRHKESSGVLHLTDHVMYGSSRLGSHERKQVELLGAGSSPITARAGIFGLERGDKRYELSNHLGNVLTVVSDRRAKASCADTLVSGYWADVVSTNDYYPFGMGMVERGDDGGYRYGFNGQERDDEVAGPGNSYTAEFWQYDARLGRRWNLDPVTKLSLSPYSTFNLNPNAFYDPDGRDGIAFFSKAKDKKVGKRTLRGGSRKNPHTITVMANYYFNAETINGIGGRDALNRAIETYNNSSFMVRGADGDFYQVEFQLAATALSDVSEADLKMCATEDNPGDYFANDLVFGNLITVDSEDRRVSGISPDGIAVATKSHINLLSSKIENEVANGADKQILLFNTFLHEIGHNLGGAHIDGGALNHTIVEQLGKGISSYDPFSNSSTKDVITQENTLTKNNVFEMINTIWFGRGNSEQQQQQGNTRPGVIKKVE